MAVLGGLSQRGFVKDTALLHAAKRRELLEKGLHYEYIVQTIIFFSCYFTCFVFCWKRADSGGYG